MHSANLKFKWNVNLKHFVERKKISAQQQTKFGFLSEILNAKSQKRKNAKTQKRKNVKSQKRKNAEKEKRNTQVDAAVF